MGNRAATTQAKSACAALLPSAMEILIDIGNSALKWALYERGAIGAVSSLLHKHVIQGELEAAWSALPRPERVLVSNVAGDAMRQIMKDLTQKLWHLSPLFAETQSHAYGVTIAYRQAQGLGVDRWLALIAAYRQGLEPALVVDCGTAVTLDAIDAQGLHLGGLIVPGLRMMWESMFSGTRIPPSDFTETDGLLGKTTQECLFSGCLQAIVGMIESTQQRLHGSTCLDVRIVLTGGDAMRVGNRLQQPLAYRPCLIMEGLHLLSGEI
jgi:type III pantothenate kinase